VKPGDLVMIDFFQGERLALIISSEPGFSEETRRYYRLQIVGGLYDKSTCGRYEIEINPLSSG